MAITPTAPTGTFTGVKAATSGTTFTVTPITTVAGNGIYIAIVVAGAQTVTGISDGGTNTYDIIGGITNSTVRTELWKARGKAAALAVATITVTLSASGSRAAACVYTYANIAYADNNHNTATGSSAAPSTGAQTLQESADYLIAALGILSATALSAPTGTIETNTTTTGCRVGLMDHTGATTETCSATSGNANWGVVWTVVRALTVTNDQMTQSDLPFGYGFPIKDVMELLDADGTSVLTGIEDLTTRGFGHWAESFRYFETGLAVLTNEYNIPLADGFQRATVTAVDPGNKVVTATTEVWDQGSPVEANSWTVGIICPHLGQNWADKDTMPSVSFEILVDTDQLNWSDALRVGYGDKTADQLTLSDFTGAGYGAGTSDQIVIVDSLSSGYGDKLSDTLTFSDGTPAVTDVWQLGIICPHLGQNWTETFAESTATAGLTLTLSDSETANWADALFAGYGSTTSDQIVIVDSLNAGYGGLLSDTITFSDSELTVLGFAILLTDTETANWNDSLRAGYGAATSDQLVIVDSMNAGYGDLLSDTITFSDFAAAGYGSLTSDQLVISDSLGAGYGGLFSDNLNNWADVVIDVIGIAVLVTDSETANWADSLGLGYGDQISDTLSMSDFTTAGYGAGTSDQLILTESVGSGYGALLSDNEGPNWSDAFADNLQGTIISEQFTDNLNNWNDYMAAGYGSLTSDQLVITDSMGSGYGAVLSDSLNNWLDALQELLSIAEVLSDSETANWNDSLKAGYGDTISEQLNLTDFAAAGYGSATSDQLVITDSIGAGYAGLLSDTIVFSDQMGLGYGDLITDTVTFSDALKAGYGAGTSDQLVILDGMGAGYGALLSDNLNNWQDAFAEVLFSPGLIVLNLSDTETNNWLDALGAGYGNATVDTLSMADFTAAGYGSKTSDNFTIVDSLNAGYGSVLSDTLNNWLDSFQESIVFALLLTDSEVNNWLDALGIGYGDQITEQLPLLDSLGSGYGSGIVDDLVMLDLMSIVWEIDFQLSDDGETNWADAIIAGSSFILQVNVSDDGEFNWNDALQSFLPLNTAPASLHAVQNSLKVVIDPFNGVLNPAIYQISTRSRILFSYYPTPAAALLGVAPEDSMNNWQEFVLPTMDRISAQLSDQLILTDELDGYFPVGYSFTDFVSEEWIDDLSFVTNQAPLFLTVSDDGEFNWQDVLSVNTEDDISVSDDGEFNWNDAVLSGASVQSVSFFDSLNNWQDVIPRIAYSAVITDNTLNNWLDQLAGIPSLLVLSDTLNNWSDFAPLLFIIGWDLAVTETLNYWTEELDALFPTGLLVTDDASGNLQDGFSDIVTGTMIQFAIGDDANFVSDTLNLGYADIIHDQLTFSDLLNIQYIAIAADQLTLTDSLRTSYGDQIADQLTVAENFTVTLDYRELFSDTGSINWADAVGALFPIGFLFSENLSNWQDAFSFAGGINPIQFSTGDNISFLNETLNVGYGDKLSDQLTFSDLLNIQYYAIITDQLTLTDSLTVGYGDKVADQLTLSDSISAGIVLMQTTTDSLNNWQDFIPDFIIVYSAVTGESISNWNDGTQLTVGSASVQLGDSMTLTDAFQDFEANTIVQMGLSDTDTSNWNDLVALSPFNPINAQFGENLNNWNDTLSEGANSGFMDTLVLSDFVRVQYGNALLDSLTVTDAFQIGTGLRITESETANWLDGLSTTWGDVIAESLNLTDSTAVGYGDSVADSIQDVTNPLFSWQDTLQFELKGGAQFKIFTSDNMNRWFDASSSVTRLNVIIADQLVLSDGSPVPKNTWMVKVGCPHLGQNWADKGTKALV